MRSGRLRIALLAAGAALCAASAAMADPSAGDEAAAAADAADRFLQTLDPAQARAAVLPPDSPLRGSLGADGGHYRSIYRNPGGEYGRDQ